MNVLASVVLLAASFQLISSQGPPSDIPEECRRPPAVDKPFDCCKLPPFFDPKDLEECGFKKFGEKGPPRGPGPRGPHPRGPHPPHNCTKQLCMLEKYSLLKDGEADQEAVSAFMTEYGKRNEEFAPAIESAKEKCLGKELPGPPHKCEADKMVFCVTTTLFSECPVWEDSDSCKTLKDHMDHCKPFFMKH